MNDLLHDDNPQAGSGRTLTLVSGVAALVALIAMLLLVARAGDPSRATASGPPGLPADTLTVGLQDERLPIAPLDEIPARLDRLKTSGVTITRVDVSWAQTAPAKPARPADPSDAAYNWQRTDIILDGLEERGIAPIVSFSQTPGWANGSKAPEWVAGIEDYGAFVRAFATRYSGSGHALVRLYEPWNEPNNAAMLMPQWEGAGASAKLVAAETYAQMLARATSDIREVTPDAAVIGLGLADIDQSAPGIGGSSVADFIAALVPLTPRLTLVSQHLQPTDAPGVASTRVPSLGGFDRYLAALDTVAPNADVLITAVGYATSPGGLTDAQQATSTTQTMTTLARQPRVRLAIWYSLQDTFERPAGLLRTDGTEKPAWNAFAGSRKSIPSERP